MMNLLEIGTVLTCNKNLEMFAGRQAVVTNIKGEEVTFKIAFANFTCNIKDIPFYFLDNKLLIDPDQFFSKTKDLQLNLERLVYDNEPVNFKQKMNGQEFRGLLLGIKEDVEAEEEYIIISKTGYGINIRHQVYDEFEDENVVNEWIVAC